MTIETTAKVEQIKRVIDSAGAVVAPATEQLQQTVANILGNRPTLSGFAYTTSSTNAEQLDASAVPDGVSVLIQAPTANGGKVYVGNDTVQPVELQPGGNVSLDVADTSAVWVKAGNSGDSVGVLHEDG